MKKVETEISKLESKKYGSTNEVIQELGLWGK